jgi:hypothetical protein
MPGIVKLIKAKVPMLKDQLKYFSLKKPYHNILQLREIIEEWQRQYNEIVVQVVPYTGDHKADVSKVIPIDINTEKKVIDNPSGEIYMPDFVQIWPLKHETYYHRCYCKGEK